jgi:hypothetical protein
MRNRNFSANILATGQAFRKAALYDQQTRRDANYDFYLQGNGHLDWIFPANTGT